MTLTLHHLEYSQSFRILWLLEKLGANYDLKVYDRDPKTRLAPKAYKAISPLGTAPVLTDGALVLSESNAIVDYILDQYPERRLRPKAGDANRADYLFWFHTAQGSHMPLLLFKAVFGSIQNRVPFFLKGLIKTIFAQVDAAFLTPRMQAIIEKAEFDLGQHKWFAGDSVSAADIVMSYGMEASQSAGYITNAHPNCLRWLSQIHEDAAYKSALKKDGRKQIIFTG